MQPPHKQPEGRFSRPPGGDVGDGWTPELLNGGRWKGEWMKKWVLIFRACTLLFSFLSFVLMITVSNFHVIGALSYVLSVAIVMVLYTAVQVGIKGHELRTSEVVISPKVAIWIDFCGDQTLAYMLLSSATAGAATIAVVRDIIQGTLEEQHSSVSISLAAASVGMSVLAFIFLAPVALFSSYCFFVNI